MPLPQQPWRSALQPASFRNAGFKVEANAAPTGRRNATHEFAKRDTPFTEDLGRRARRYTFTAYVIGPNYLDAKNALIAACEQGGSGTLVHPTLGTLTVNCDVCASSESRERGGFCTFELGFVESGALDTNGVTQDTQRQSTAAAGTLKQSSAASLDTSLKAVNTETIST